MKTIKRDENGRKIMRVQRGTARALRRIASGKRTQPVVQQPITIKSAGW